MDLKSERLCRRSGRGNDVDGARYVPSGCDQTDQIKLETEAYGHF